jgi:DNA-binding PadR family transcriptional regulator
MYGDYWHERAADTDVGAATGVVASGVASGAFPCGAGGEAGDKRVYRLTDDGEREVEEQATAIRRIWRWAEEWGDWGHASRPEAWEIARPAMELAKAALHAVARGEDDPDRVERVREILENARCGA